MAKREIIIKAESRDEVLAKATSELGALEDNMNVEQVADGSFRITLKNAPADVEIDVSRDKMKAFVRRILPPIGEGPPLDEQMVLRALDDAEVTFGINNEAIAKVIEKAKNPEEKMETAVVAEGRPPQKGEDAFLEKIGNLDFPVLPGAVAARKVPPKPAVAGQNICGEELPVKREPADIKVIPGQNIDYDPKTNEVKSACYGIVTVAGQRVSAENYLKLADNKIRVTATIQAKLADDTSLRSRHILDILAGLSVTYGIKEDVIHDAILKSESTGEMIEDVIIAEGDSPVFGTDASFEYLRGSASMVGQDIEGGRIDFRERGLINNVAAGDLLVRKKPATKGTPGKTVTDETVSAQDGLDKNLSVDQSIEVSEDGLEFSSKVDGLMIVRENSLSVTESYNVDGNVDYSTGNIRVKRGAVNIKGNVLPSFKVKAGGDVIVEGTIEDAVVEAGNALYVGRGILHRDFGTANTGGDVIALFAENARIEAGGTVNIKNNISNCQVKAGKDVIVTEGKGKIVGGTVVAAGRIEVKDIGSELGVATNVVVGGDYSNLQELDKKKAEYNKTDTKDVNTLGKGTDKEILQRFPVAKRKKIRRTACRAQVIDAGPGREHDTDTRPRLPGNGAAHRRPALQRRAADRPLGSILQ